MRSATEHARDAARLEAELAAAEERIRLRDIQIRDLTERVTKLERERDWADMKAHELTQHLASSTGGGI